MTSFGKVIQSNTWGTILGDWPLLSQQEDAANPAFMTEAQIEDEAQKVRRSQREQTCSDLCPPDLNALTDSEFTS